jgi:hypothetical protein
VAALSLVGDGSKVYVVDEDPRTRRQSPFLGEIADKKPRFVRLPKDIAYPDHTSHFHEIRDRDGAIWIPSMGMWDPGACHVDHTGVLQQLHKVGLPVMVDQAGNLWLATNRGRVWDEFNIWRHGRIVQKVQIPQAESGTFLFSDRPGSVYALTSVGLRHLTAQGPKFDAYRIDKLHPVEGLIGQMISAGYSSHGYLAIVTALDARSGPNYYLYLIKLPNNQQ